MISSVQDAVRQSVARNGSKRIAVVPEGPYVVPLFQPEGRAAE